MSSSDAERLLSDALRQLTEPSRDEREELLRSDDDACIATNKLNVYTAVQPARKSLVPTFHYIAI